MVPAQHGRTVSSAPIIFILGLMALLGTIVASATSAVAAGVTVTPASIAFGNVVIGTSPAQTVVVANGSNGAIQFQRIVASTPFLTTGNTCNGSLGGGQACHINVGCQPTAFGTVAGALTFFLNKDQKVIVNLTCNGVSATPMPAIFVTNSFPVNNISTVTAYPLGSSGNVPSLIPTGLGSPSSLAKDASGKIYVANEGGGSTGNGSISIYQAGSTGQVLPIATISGVNTGLAEPVSIALDSAANIYVSNFFGGPSLNGSITEYAAGSNGDVAPLATITATNFAVFEPQGIAVDPTGNIYIANFNGSISVFPPGSNGNATPSASIAGPLTGLAGPSGLALDSADNIYVSNHGGGQQNSSSITVFAAGSNGNVAPIGTINGPDTMLNGPGALALDSRGNIYAANSSNAINVYRAGKFGDLRPSATISGADTGLASPAGLFVDSSIYVANSTGNDLTLYPSGANGNVAPAATLSNPLTGLDGPSGIAFDASGNAYVVNSFLNIGNPSGSVTVYPAGNYGVAGAPTVTITGSNTGLFSPSGIAVDPSGNIYVSNRAASPSTNGSVTVYTPGSNGNVMPNATIVAADNGLGNFDPTGIALDTGGNIYVPFVAAMGHSISYGVDMFAAGSNGTVTPSSIITGLQTQLDQPHGIALDFQRNIYVTNNSTNSITIFGTGSNGNVVPSAVISGANTGLTEPVGIGVDSSGNVYVANSYSSFRGSTGTVTVYAPGSNGNVAPIETISGGDTGLRSPLGLALGFISP